VRSPAAEDRGGTSHPICPGDGDGRGSRSLGTEQPTRSAQTTTHTRQGAEAYEPDRRRGTAACETFMNLCRTRRDGFMQRRLHSGDTCPLEPTRMRIPIPITFQLDDCPSFGIFLSVAGRNSSSARTTPRNSKHSLAVTDGCFPSLSKSRVNECRVWIATYSMTQERVVLFRETV
jgi:hypothetical protein